MLGENVTEEFKPAEVPAFWSARKMAEWLANPSGDGFPAPPPPGPFGRLVVEGFLPAWPRDERTHVAIDPQTGTAKESQLFTTAALDLTTPPGADKARPGLRPGAPVKLAARVEVPPELVENVRQLCEWHPLGGERRLALWCVDRDSAAGSQPAKWSCPELLAQCLRENPKRVRMVLATPGIFGAVAVGRGASVNQSSGMKPLPGWLPKWLQHTQDGLVGCPPGLHILLRLVGVCTGRWSPVSGWSLRLGSHSPGPKPIRRMVPAGAVYFFEVLEGNTAELAQRGWLWCVSDDRFDRRDGFGRVLWGIW